MLNALIALVLAVAIITAPPSAAGSAAAEGPIAPEIVEDLDPEIAALDAVTAPMPLLSVRPTDNANASDPASPAAMPPPVPPPERRS